MCCLQLYKKNTVEITRREEEIWEQEQQNVTASVEHASCFGLPCTEALQVRETLRLLCISSWELGSTSNTCVILTVRIGNVFAPTLHLTNCLNKKILSRV
jgi:hypothetical protein